MPGTRGHRTLPSTVPPTYSALLGTLSGGTENGMPLPSLETQTSQSRGTDPVRTANVNSFPSFQRLAPLNPSTDHRGRYQWNPCGTGLASDKVRQPASRGVVAHLGVGLIFQIMPPLVLDMRLRHALTFGITGGGRKYSS